MSVRYSADLFFAAIVKKADFCSDSMQEVILCAHEEAVNVKFCPKCGLPQNKRKKTERFEEFSTLAASAMADLLGEDFDADEDEADGDKEKTHRHAQGTWKKRMLEAAQDGTKIGGLEVFAFEDDVFMLGEKISKLDPGEMSDYTWTQMESARERVKSRLAAIGVERDVKFYATLDCQ